MWLEEKVYVDASCLGEQAPAFGWRCRRLAFTCCQDVALLLLSTSIVHFQTTTTTSHFIVDSIVQPTVFRQVDDIPPSELYLSNDQDVRSSTMEATSPVLRLSIRVGAVGHRLVRPSVVVS